MSESGPCPAIGSIPTTSSRPRRAAPGLLGSSRPRGAWCSACVLLGTIVALAPGLARAQQAAPADECPTSSPRFRVGHTIRYVNVSGAFDPNTQTQGEIRPIQVQLWDPARDQDDCDESADFEQGPSGCQAPPTVYRSRLYGQYGDLLAPLNWSPLSWTISAANAFEDARVARGDDRFPVVVFSHGNDNDAIDYAYTLEALASYGYIVAAPDHLNNTQEEVRIDFANAALRAAHQQNLIPCFDNAPYDVAANGDLHCARPIFPSSVPPRLGVAKSMVDRYHDVQAVLDALPAWFGVRADMERVGVMGHSRGTVTSLSAAGGSSLWGRAEGVDFLPDPRIKAVMGLAIGGQPITLGVDLENVTVPVLLVAARLDKNSPWPVSQLAIASMPASTDKQLVVIENAVHRHFDSGYCAELQSSAAIAQAPIPAGSPLPRLDRQTATQILVSPLSGLAIDYCALSYFETPANIEGFVQPIVAQSVPAFTFSSPVPTLGLSTDTVKDTVISLAVPFFARVLDRADGDDRPFADCLPPELVNQTPVAAPTAQDASDTSVDGDDPD